MAWWTYLFATIKVSLLYSIIPSSSAQSIAPIRVGIQASPGQAYVDMYWKPIFDDVASQLGTTSNVTAIATDDDAYTAVSNSALDYFYVGGALYNCLQGQFGVAAIASSYQIVNGVSTDLIGPQIIARKDSNISTISQIRGRRVAIPQLGYLSAGQAQWFQLFLEGIELFKDTDTVIITQKQTSTILAVYTNVVDVGFITSGQLELAAASGFFSASEFTTVNRVDSLFPGNISTAPPPGSVLVALKHVPLSDRTAVASKLYAMNTSLSLMANISRWVSPQNYLPVLVLQQALNLYSFPPDGSAPSCVRSRNAQDYVTCRPGFVKDDSVVCKLNNNTCPSIYTCLCNPCRPPPHSRGRTTLIAATTVPIVVIVLSMFTCLGCMIRFSRLRVHTIPWKDIAVMDVIGANSFGLVRQGTLNDEIVALKRAQLEPDGDPEFDLPRLNRKTTRVRKLSVLYNQLPIMTQRRKRALNILTNTIHHENVCPIIGITYGPIDLDLIIVTPYMKNGSVYDLLINASVDIHDNMRLAILRDILAALRALHNRRIFGRDIRSHHFLLDDSYNVKLSSVNTIASQKHIQEERRVWLSPENQEGTHNNEQSDIYALGMLIYEMFYRKPPYDGISLSDVLTSWKPPQVDNSRFNDDLHALMQACWATDPLERPRLDTLQEYLDKQARVSLAEAVFTDPKRARILLKQILPMDDANCVKEGRKVPCRTYKDVTIAVITPIDIDRTVGKAKAAQVCRDLHAKFTQICTGHALMPLTSVDHRYIAVGNLVSAQPDHSARIAQFCLDVIDSVTVGGSTVNLASSLEVNIGIHTGEVFTHVMGSSRPCFVCRGKTMTIAQRMSDTSQSGVVQLSSTTFNSLKHIEKFKNNIARRMGCCQIRGIGAVESYWLYTVDSSSLRHRHLIRQVAATTTPGSRTLSKSVQEKADPPPIRPP